MHLFDGGEVFKGFYLQYAVRCLTSGNHSNLPKLSLYIKGTDLARQAELKQNRSRIAEWTGGAPKIGDMAGNFEGDEYAFLEWSGLAL